MRAFLSSFLSIFRFLFDFNIFFFLFHSLQTQFGSFKLVGCIEIFAQFHLSRFTLARFYFYDHVIVLPLCRCFVQYVFESHWIIQNGLVVRARKRGYWQKGYKTLPSWIEETTIGRNLLGICSTLSFGRNILVCVVGACSTIVHIKWIFLLVFLCVLFLRGATEMQYQSHNFHVLMLRVIRFVSVSRENIANSIFNSVKVKNSTNWQFLFFLNCFYSIFNIRGLN